MSTQKEPSRQRPCMYRYLDYREWLHDWFLWKKEVNPNYSYRVFSRFAQLAPGTLNNVIHGRRRPNAETIAGLAKGAEMSSAELSFFTSLVELEEAPDLKTRNEVLRRVLEHPEVQEIRRLEGQHARYLSHWYFVAIRELAQLPGFKRDPEWIAARLYHGIDAARASEALEVLLDLGLLVEDGAGGLRPAELRLETAAQVAGGAFINHHEEMMSLSAEALRGVPPEERYFGTVTLTVSEEVLSGLQQECIDFLHRVMNLTDQPGLVPTRVIQLNLQLFPMTRKMQ